MAVEPAMDRTKVMLPPELRKRAEREARSRGISLDELIQEALGRLLSSGSDDPLFADRAIYSGPVPADSVMRHDALLYGPAKLQ
jgi:hypothetical protein